MTARITAVYSNGVCRLRGQSEQGALSSGGVLGGLGGLREAKNCVFSDTHLHGVLERPRPCCISLGTSIGSEVPGARRIIAQRHGIHDLDFDTKRCFSDISQLY